MNKHAIRTQAFVLDLSSKKPKRVKPKMEDFLPNYPPPLSPAPFVPCDLIGPDPYGTKYNYGPPDYNCFGLPPRQEPFICAPPPAQPNPMMLQQEREAMFAYARNPPAMPSVYPQQKEGNDKKDKNDKKNKGKKSKNPLIVEPTMVVPPTPSEVSSNTNSKPSSRSSESSVSVKKKKIKKPDLRGVITRDNILDYIRQGYSYEHLARKFKYEYKNREPELKYKAKPDVFLI